MSGRDIRENLIFLLAASMVFLSEPALAAGQAELKPLNFTESLPLARGSLTPLSEDGSYLEPSDACTFLVEKNGWKPESCQVIDAVTILSPESVDTTIVAKPNDDGFVPFDDWDKGNRDEEIQAIWDAAVTQSAEQSERAGVNIQR